jgi:hypothetical protein
MEWKAPTMRDRESLPNNPTVRAPCCGRKTSADMLVDVSGLPSEVRPQAAVYMCDACRERVFADGVMTREEFYSMYDPPAAAVARITEYEEKR